jgi:uncharacterized protein (TIGR02231 family)
MKGYLSALLLLITTALFAQKEITVKSQLTNANVYYGYGAELSHKAKVSLQNGSNDVIIENIANVIDPNTIQISVPENTVLLSYRFNQKTIVLSDPNPAIKRVEDSIKLVQKLLSAATNDATIISDLLDKTSRLIETYSSAPNKNLSTIDLIKLLDYYTNKVQGYRNALFVIQTKKEDLSEQLANLQARVEDLGNENGGNASKVVGELILQLMAQQVTTADLGISYFTQNAGWIPTYDMRVKSVDNSFRLVYKASLNQTTGLDWKQVKLTLSTSNPNQGNNKYPTLNPLFIQLYNPNMYKEMQNKAAAANYNRAQSLDRAMLGASVTTISAEDIKDDVSDYLTLNEGQLNTTFEIDLPYDIPSDGKSYSVAIKEEKLNATYKHYSIPKLDKDAFLLAEISEWENLDLLPGDANIIMDNVYLGKSFIDPNTTMDTLNLSLGRDKRVAVKRLLVKEFSKAKLKGDNKTETFTFEITVKNNKSKDVAMLLKDQFPISNLTGVVVKLENDGGSEVNEELGTVNWKINLKPGESKKYRFSYSVTYPKDQKIANLR